MTFLKTWQAQVTCPDSFRFFAHQPGLPVGFINPHLSGCDVDSVNVCAFTTSGMRALLHHRADSSASGSPSSIPQCFSQSWQTPQRRCSQLPPAPPGPPLGRSWLLLVQPPPLPPKSFNQSTQKLLLRDTS